MEMKRKNIFLLWGTLTAACLAPMGLLFTARQASAEETISYALEEILTPVWEGEISYQESVLPVYNTDGTIDPIPLLYPIEEIVEVKNASLSVTYKEGVDYTLSNGEFVVLGNGSIPVLPHRVFHPMSNDLNIKDADGGYLCFHEGDWFHSRQIVVTYRHKAGYTGYIPEGKRERLPNTLNKLGAKEDLDLLVFGDSISVGGNASGFLNVAPFMPTYPELFAQGLEKEYGVKVNIRNFSVGGQDSTWGAREIENVLKEVDNVDLAIVAFGMNDATLDDATYLANVTRISDTIRSQYNHAETLLVASMLPNPKAVGFWGNQVNFYEVLEAYEKTAPKGVAVVNMTKTHEGLLQRKRYEDMTGNNVNHTNDYLSRVYAQTLLKTLQEEPLIEEPSITPEESDAAAPKQGCGSALASVGGGLTALLLCGGVLAKRKK